MQEMIEFAKETGMNQGMKRASFFIKDFVSKLFSISKITVFFFFFTTLLLLLKFKIVKIYLNYLPLFHSF